ncbi:hypothetical protein BaRGS_00027111, partial [Batillaria attramentaria]
MPSTAPRRPNVTDNAEAAGIRPTNIRVLIKLTAMLSSQGKNKLGGRYSVTDELCTRCRGFQRRAWLLVRTSQGARRFTPAVEITPTGWDQFHVYALNPLHIQKLHQVFMYSRRADDRPHAGRMTGVTIPFPPSRPPVPSKNRDTLLFYRLPAKHGSTPDIACRPPGLRETPQAR